jgi:hypothetical protein
LYEPGELHTAASDRLFFGSPALAEGQLARRALLALGSGGSGRPWRTIRTIATVAQSCKLLHKPQLEIAAHLGGPVEADDETGLESDPPPAMLRRIGDVPSGSN